MGFFTSRSLRDKNGHARTPLDCLENATPYERSKQGKTVVGNDDQIYPFFPGEVQYLLGRITLPEDGLDLHRAGFLKFLLIETKDPVGPLVPRLIPPGMPLLTHVS